jgi:HEAT repeat protein
MRRLRHGSLAFLMVALLSACSTTEEQVRDQIETLAANEIGSQAWLDGVDELVALGRPGARQLVLLLDPGQYRGPRYREFRSERERARTGAATVLGKIRHRAASASMDDRITVAYTYPERHAALRAVGDLGFTTVAVTNLTAQLADSNETIRLMAAVALLKMGEETALDTIRVAIASDRDAEAQIAIEELEHANHFGVGLLVELRDGNSRRKERLEQALEVVRRQLQEQLTDDDPEVRRESAKALGDIGHVGALEPLAALLDDASNLVRYAAATSLARLRDTRGVEYLFAGLDNDDPIQRLNTVRSLIDVERKSGGLGQRLLSSLDAPNPRLRSAAAQILGQAHVDDAVPALIEATTDNDAQVRWSAVISLGRLGTSESRQALQALVDDDDDTVAYYAQWALDRLGAG